MRILSKNAVTIIGVPAIALVMATAWTGAGAADVDVSRYNVIWQSSPFGAPRVAPRTPVQRTQPKVSPQRSWAKDLRVCYVSEPQVGIMDAKQKWNALLTVGESAKYQGANITLVEADFEGEAAAVQKGDDKQWINANGCTGTKVASPGSFSPFSQATGARTSPAPAGHRIVRRNTYAKSMMKKRAEVLERRRKKNAELRRSMTSDQFNDMLRKENLNRIRAGGELGPPLPIPLTPEEDATLVREGVLEPR